jgi:hypothetical protein
MASPSSGPTSSCSRWSRRQLLYGFAALAASSALSGCGASLYRAASSTTSKQPTPSQPSTTTPALIPQPLPIGAITAASLTIAATSAGDFTQGFVGLAYEKQSLTTPIFSAANSDLIGLFQRLGTSVLRIGGASVDENVWTPDGRGQTIGQIAPADVDALAAFLRATGWTCIYGINFGGSATGATTPALAAAEVSYVSQQLGSALIGVELGNACETYGDPGSFYAGQWSVERFEPLWQLYRTSILDNAPSISFAGPAAASDVDSWTLPFGEYVTSKELGLLTQHYNRGSASTATVDDLISPDTTLASELLQLHYGAQSIGVPFRLDACSAYADSGVAGVSDAYASALWAIDMIFSSALGGASGLNFQSGGEQPCTPIADNAGAVLGPQPIFYGLLLAMMAGQGTLLSTQLSADSLNVTAYALQSTSGGMSIVVVNKDATQNLDLSITLPQSLTQTMNTATLQQMTQLSSGATSPSLTALSGVTIQDAAVAADGAFEPAAAYGLTLTGAQLSCYVPALSAVLIQLA